MGATLHARGVSAAHGARPLFADLDLVIADGDVWGLLGANGSGKSTLLHALAGRPGTAEITGTIATSPPDATVGLLEQEADRRPGETVRGFLRRRTGVTAAEVTMEAAAEAMASAPEDAAVGDAYSAALERWLALGGADIDERIPRVAADLGLTVGVDALMTALSGGQAARVGLGALLLSRYDVLLLDEPTNDLDSDGLERLERFVLETRVPLVVVSHDREFLARCTTGIVELDIAQRQISVYDGGYDAFLEERELARRRAREAYEEYEGRVGDLRDRLQTQKTWLAKGVRNAMRKAPDNDKHIRHRAGQRSEKQAAKISQTERAIERLETVEEPRKEWELRMSIASAPRSGSVVAVLDEAVVSRGDFVLGPVTLQIDAGDRIGVVGPNGSGKSTLLALLLGRISPDSGRARLGSGVLIGEVDQARSAFDGPAPLVERLSAEIPDTAPAEVRSLLAKFGLAADHVDRPCSSLSPGERTRAGLALLQARGVNLLVLDEPTNHLDLPAIEQLEAAIESFDGTVLLVTHDRRMLASTRLTRTLTVADGHVS